MEKYCKATVNKPGRPTVNHCRFNDELMTSVRIKGQLGAIIVGLLLLKHLLLNESFTSSNLCHLTDACLHEHGLISEMHCDKVVVRVMESNVHSVSVYVIRLFALSSHMPTVTKTSIVYA